MAHVVPALATPSVALAGSSDRFPVRRIICVGRNYAAHVREMGGDEREAPFFFTKPADAIVADASTVPYPMATANYHHEVELVVAIGKGGANIAKGAALDHIYGYAVGFDMTRRDLQLAARDKGRPWDMGKAFDQSAPIAAIHAASDVGHLETGAIWIKVNDETRQQSVLEAMIWNVPETIEHLSALVALAPGDLIYTGTPEGVSAVVSGDKLHGHIDGLTDLHITIA